MTPFGPALLGPLGFVSHIGTALACTLALLWVWRFGDVRRSDRSAAMAALALTALWAAVAAALGGVSPLAQGAESLRNLGWIVLLLKLFSNDGRDESVRAVRPVIVVLGAIALAEPLAIGGAALRAGALPSLSPLAAISPLLHMLLAIGALVLVHNLYAGASHSARVALRWSAAALALGIGYDLNLYSLVYFTGASAPWMFALRGLAVCLVAIGLAIGSSASSAALVLRPSRKATFQTLSLLLIGAYLFVLLVFSRWMSALGSDAERVVWVVVLVAGGLAVALWLPSRRLRSWLKVMVSKHLFQHRYDYREEWLRFTRTIGGGKGESASLHQRAIKALADITESSGGLLLMPDEEARLRLCARWQWSEIEVPARAARFDFASFLEEHNYIVDLDRVRSGEDDRAAPSLVPDWLLDAHEAWVVVPLLHFDRLIAAVVLTRPTVARHLDWEDLDLLRVTGRQLASYLAEQMGQEALMEASRFDEFNRRIAFVMHDIKNLASQLSLLARNAERHADNPRFREDMLITLRNSSEKLNNLLSRLSRYGAGRSDRIEPIELGEFVRGLRSRFAQAERLQILGEKSCSVLADAEALEQALVHLVQNALDASEMGQKVFIDISSDGTKARIEVIDEGCGMSPEFIRNGLFKPFVSSKPSGFGIGAFEARELVRAMGGALDVDSREGVGTRFSIELPLAKAGECARARAAGAGGQASEGAK